MIAIKRVNVEKQCNDKEDCQGDEEGEANALFSDEYDSLNNSKQREKLDKEFKVIHKR